jgi:probable F420-dependent oxidoreductase
MRVGALIASEGLSDPGYLRATGDAVEAFGLDSIWLADHIVIPHGHQTKYPYSPDGRLTSPPYPEPLTTLAYLAAVTTRVELGTAVLVLPQRNPILVAKQAATVHQLSGGRLRLGIGVGWLREEFDALHEDFATRGPRTDEYIDIMRLLWCQDAPVYNGTHASLDGTVSIEPRPPSSVPFVIGGHSPAAARRAGRRGDGFFPLVWDLDQLRAVYQLAAAELSANGRAPAELELLAMTDTDPARAKALAELGVQHLVVAVAQRQPDIGKLVERLERIRELADQVALLE